MSREQIKTIYLAGGCFWGVEGYFQRVKGIVDTEVGYANGVSEDTDYQRLSTTDHAETLRLRYDASKIHLAEILDRFYRIIDPNALNRQGNDIGRQYRTGIYYDDDSDLPVIETSLTILNNELEKPHVIECLPLAHFVVAENVHQDYLKNNPRGYCHINLSAADAPLYPGAPKPDDATLKDRLPPDVYHVTREKGTEHPFSSLLDAFKDRGIYVDVVSGQPLFSSRDKYDAGCGWPSFTMPITTDAMRYLNDTSHGMHRIEVVSDGAESHLGHVFPDGPKETGGLRYCINGVSLRFVPEADMKQEGYERLLPYL